MKKLTLIFLITFPVLLYSQKNDSTENWSVSLHFSPNNYTYRTVKRIPGKPITSYLSHPYKTADQIPSSGYSALFSINYKIKHFNFKSGLILDKYAYGTVPVLDTLYDSWHSISEITTNYYPVDFLFLGIPFRMEVSAGLSKHIELYAGIGSNSYIAGMLDMPHFGRTFGIPRAFSLNATLGTNLKARNVSIGIAPVYNHFITPFYDYNTQEGEADKLFLYSLGIEYHLAYTFHKKN